MAPRVLRRGHILRGFMSLRITGVSVIKNEADIIETFVRHNLGYLDALVILENSSTDRSREILVQLVREGLPLVVMDDPELGHHQSEKLTDLIQTAHRAFRPDWIIPLDADEFLNPAGGFGLAELLADLPEESVGQMEWRNYVPMPGDNLNEPDIIKRIRHRRTLEKPQYYKVVIPGSLIATNSIIVDFGNHAVRHRNGSYPFAHYIMNSLPLAHFPIRSSGQILTKAFISWLTELCKEDREIDGWHKEPMYRRFLDNAPLTPEELRDAAMRYALQSDEENNITPDGVVSVSPYELKYTDMIETNQALAMARVSEDLAARWREVTNRPGAKSRSETGSKCFPDIVDNKNLEPLDHIMAGTVDAPPFRYIYDLFRPSSVLDVGFNAAYLELLESLGVEDVVRVTVEGFGARAGNTVAHNPSSPLDPGGKFDIVICSELIALLDEADAGSMIKSLAACAKGPVLFSAGENAANPKSPDHWMPLWREGGFEPLPFNTAVFRMLANMYWYKRGSFLLAPVDRTGVRRTEDFLPVDDLAHMTEAYRDHKPQKPGVYEITLLGDRLETSHVKPPELVLRDTNIDIAALLLRRARIHLNMGRLEESIHDLESALDTGGEAEDDIRRAAADMIVAQSNLAERVEDTSAMRRLVELIEKHKDTLDR